MATLLFDEAKHEYTLAGCVLPSVTQILVDQGLIDTTWFTDEGRDRGTAVHLALKYLDEGSLDADTVDEDLHGYIYAYEKFKRETGFIPDSGSIEVPMFHPILSYAGTPDRIGTLFRKRVILDFKTGEIEPWVGLQLGGYEAMVQFQQQCHAIDFDRYALQLKKDGKYKLHPFKNDREVDLFTGMAGIFHWKRNHKMGGK